MGKTAILGYLDGKNGDFDEKNGVFGQISTF
jgi:hypothetical protein